MAVEYVQPLVWELNKDGAYEYCSWCSRAFESIMLSNLTLFQIVTGDGWSMLARPLVEKHPASVILFVAVIFTMVFGLLNLITAVIVDTAAQARESDVMQLARQKQTQRDD